MDAVLAGLTFLFQCFWYLSNGRSDGEGQPGSSRFQVEDGSTDL